MEQIAQGFENKTSFPNCMGALVGKHIRILCPDQSGCLFFNYQNYNAIDRLVLVQTNYKFIYVDIGAYCNECDHYFSELKYIRLIKKKTMILTSAKTVTWLSKTNSCCLRGR